VGRDVGSVDPDVSVRETLGATAGDVDRVGHRHDGKPGATGAEMTALLGEVRGPPGRLSLRQVG